MNEPKNTDFFPVIIERDAHLVAPEMFEPYQETDEERLHEMRLREIEAQIDEKLGVDSSVEDDELGELPYDAEADRKRWDTLEKDFERLFEDAARRAD